MDEMKLRIMNAVAGKLAAAPDTAAKTELIEELSENLYRRYQDLISSGVEGEAAFGRAMDDLGDVDELLRYLGEIPPEGPRPEGGQGAGEHDWSDWPGKEELNDLIDNVGGVVRSALEQANDALRQAKESMRQAPQENWRPVDDFTEKDGEEEKKSGGWEFSAELDTDKGKFFAGAGPKQEPVIVSGIGYDRDKGGFYTRWGEWKDTPEGESGPTGAGASKVNTWFEGRGNGAYAVRTDVPLRGIDVQTVNGDVTVRLSEDEDEDGPVLLGGDVDKLEVKVTPDGTLAIRQGKTASSSFFFMRGLTSADVELYLPRRRWEFLQVSATNGDVEVEDGVELDRLAVRTANGDLRCDLESCGQLYFKSASGDLECNGLTGTVRAETMSGDIRVDGDLSEAVLSSTSGDVELEGSAERARLTSVSGDLRLCTSMLPTAAVLSTKSGDCELCIPEGPFSVKFKTVSGDVSSDFFDFAGSGRSLGFDYQGGGPVYYLSSVSGDLELTRN